MQKKDIGRPMALTLKAVVVGKNGKVLLIRRSKEKEINPGMWDLPGGHIEKSETVKEALLREVQEETGLLVEPGPIIRVVEFEKGHEAFKQEKRGLRFIAWAENEDVQLSREHEKFIWLELDEAIEKFSLKKGFEKEKRETLEAAKKYLELVNAQENWKRVLADFENFKKRTERSNSEFRKFCLEGFILEMLPVLDNFEMALKHIPKKELNSNWVVGIMHIKSQLQKIIEDQGVREIPVSKGDEINEQIHHVISDNKSGGNKVVKRVLKKGYKLDDKVIRPSNVEV